MRGSRKATQEVSKGSHVPSDLQPTNPSLTNFGSPQSDPASEAGQQLPSPFYKGRDRDQESGMNVQAPTASLELSRVGNPISPHHIHHNILSDLMTAQDPRDGVSRTKTSHLPPEMSGVPQKGAMGSRRQGTHLLAGDRVHVPAITTAALLDIPSQTRARLLSRVSSSLGPLVEGKLSRVTHTSQKNLSRVLISWPRLIGPLRMAKGLWPVTQGAGLSARIILSESSLRAVRSRSG